MMVSDGQKKVYYHYYAIIIMSCASFLGSGIK